MTKWCKDCKLCEIKARDAANQELTSMDSQNRCKRRYDLSKTTVPKCLSGF